MPSPTAFLVRDGITDYCIVLPLDASPSERWAASELADHVFEMTGTRIPVSSGNRTLPAIFVGPGPDAARLCPDVDWRALGDEGYVIRTVGKDLVLAGGRKRGSMYAVFGLLEDHLGCHWFAPGVKHVPRRPVLPLPDINEKITPVFEYRDVHNFNVADEQWMARNRLNDCYPEHPPKTEQFGGKHFFSPFVHSFSGLVPARQYFSEHPEYFSLTTGQQLIVGKHWHYPLWFVRILGGRIDARLGTAGDNVPARDGPVLTPEVWHDVAVVFDRNGFMTRYLDGCVYGTRVDISKLAGVNLNSSVQLTIGSKQMEEGPSGLIDEVRLYKRALTPDEVAAAAAPEPRVPEGAAGCWLFDDGVVNPAGNQARDSSTNDNTGTVYGCQWMTSSQDAAIRGGALLFDGHTNYVDCGDPVNGSLDVGTNDFTVMTRLKIAAFHRSSNAQLCLGNPDVLRITVSNVLNICRTQHPNVVSVSQNDRAGPCICPTCRALDDHEGTPAASNIRFVNAVAEAVEKEFPGVAIETLAYQYSLKAPKTIVPRSNVIVRVCSVACCFAHPLERKCQAGNADFVNTVKDWRRLADRLYIWNYNIDFGNAFQMFPNFQVLGPNMRFFRDMQAKGVFEESGGMGCIRMGTFHHIRAYVLAKLLWNPEYDVDQAVDDYLKTYYGPAWEPLRAYLDLCTARIQADGAHLPCFAPRGAPYMREADLRQAQQLFDRAQTLVADNPGWLRHVRIERLSLDWLCLTRAAGAKAPRASIAAVLQRFASALRSFDPETIGQPGHERLQKALSEFAALWPAPPDGTNP